MPATYDDAIGHLYALGHELAAPPPLPDGTPAPRRKFDLAYMRILAEALGAPQILFPSILVAGTNGKGSTAATLASILMAAGYRTGLYTSPHLVRVNERIQINGLPIPDEDFARLYFRVDDAAQHLVTEGRLPHHPSFFEVLTALAFCYFAGSTEPFRPAIDIAVLEIGLGGRLDATNIVDPLLSIITDIALDHQEYLGTTIPEITREKAGILRPNGILITLPQHPEANQALGEIAREMPNLVAISATSYIPTRETLFTPGTEPSDPQAEPLLPCHTEPNAAASPLPRNHYHITLDDQPFEVDSPLPGQHQQRNIALAIAAAHTLRNLDSYNLPGIRNHHSYDIPDAAIHAGIRNTQWPGRLEQIAGSPSLLLDVAHNPAGAWTLRAAIAALPENRPRTLLFSCLGDKDLSEISRILFPLFDSSEDSDPARRRDHILLTQIHNPRATSFETLHAAAQVLSIPALTAPDTEAALAQARALTPPDGLILVTGSVYLIGEIRHLLQNEGAPLA